MLFADTTTIDTLRVRGASENSPVLRLALSSMLNNADLKPKGVSPSTILIVRSLSDPLPGHLKPQQGVMRVDIDWERAVQDSLLSIYHQAARPVNGYIPSDADAVLFADEGEMLACLALDMSTGEALGRWWWKVVMRSFPSQSSDGLADLLFSRAIYVPAALHHLADWGKAGSVVSSLSPEQAMAVISAMSREFDTVDFSSDIVLATKEIDVRGIVRPGSEIIKPDGEEKLTVVPSIYEHPGIQPSTTPWQRWLLSVPHSLEKERVLLLGLGLSLFHEPAMVRTSDFLRELHNWWIHHEVPSAGETYLHERILSPSSEFKAKDNDVPSAGETYLHERILSPSSEVKTKDNDVPSAGEMDLHERILSPSSEVKTKDNDVPSAGETYLHERILSPSSEVKTKDNDVPSAGETYLHERILSPSSEVKAKDNETPTSSLKHLSPDIDLKRTDADIKEKDTDDTATQFNVESTGSVPQTTEEENIDKDDFTYKDKTRSILNEVSGSGFIDGNQPDGMEGSLIIKSLISKETTDTQSFKIYEVSEEGVDTQLGGVLYLINLMRQLDLPACFERLTDQVGAWSVLEVLGRGLLGKNNKHLAQDPLWEVLALLNGHDPGKLPGETFHGINVFRLPTGWVKYIAGEDSSFYWATDGERLRLWSEICLMADYPVDTSSPEEQLRNELRTYSDNTGSTGLISRPFDQAPIENITGILVEGLNPHLMGWLTRVIPFIRSWLIRALYPGGVEEPDLKKMLLLRRGRLYVTSTHMDLVMSMNDISLPVRMAGLDSDPGWLADFGRVVRFHFE